MSLFVKPNPDKTVNGNPIKVVHPLTGKELSQNGEAVARNLYWIKRLRDGDVIKISFQKESENILQNDYSMWKKDDFIAELSKRGISLDDLTNNEKRKAALIADDKKNGGND